MISFLRGRLRMAVAVPSTDPLATFRLDVKYAQVASALAVAGIDTILLKGPAFDQLLFDGARLRGYADIDVLVDPAQVHSAERVLAEIGFRRAPAVRRPLKPLWIALGIVRAAHATAWVRDGDLFTLDVHHTLPQVRASAAGVWRALDAHRTTITVVETEVETLDRTASALLIALHAAHHGPGWNRARKDLVRACEVLGSDSWQAAAKLARALEAERQMGIGLGTTDEGRSVARELGLRTRPTPGLRLRWLGTGARVSRRRR
jgi:Uncharacterised nucleotidyltransferase